MSGLFGSLNIGVRGMTAAQTALQTTSHNLSSMNTTGYSRQRVNLEANNPYTSHGVGQLGTGVRISGVVRIADDYVTKQIQKENASLTRHATKSEVLGQLETIFNEPSDTGLSAGFGRFYSAWNYLGANPELATAKTMVSQESQTLTDTVSQMASQLESLQGDTIHSIEKDVLDFNEKVDQLATLNKQIFNVVIKGQSPNDLLDQRDVLTTELASIADLEITYDKFQGVSLKLDKVSILEGDTINKLAVVSDKTVDGELAISTGSGKPIIQTGDFAIGQIVIADQKGSYQPLTLSNGSIKGSQEALEIVEAKKTELNQLVRNFAQAVNTIHSDGSKGLNFFEFSSDEPAKTIKVNKELTSSPIKINAGKDIAHPVSGDGSRATAISSLANAKLNYFTQDFNATYKPDSIEFEAQVGGSSTGDAYKGIVTSMGIMKQQSDNLVASQSVVVGFLQDRQAAISGVNMNEEVIDMMRFQSAFEANARIISVIDGMLDTLINRTGV